ncbi:hypothetical protein NG819_15515 [Pseudarthrobacter sp. Fe7]|nr:hypothetical protein NG819_15515 [Pseudarthrobacter sp. Fe7]
MRAGGGGGGRTLVARGFARIKNRGVEDGCIAVCDGLKGFPEAITTSGSNPWSGRA